MSDRRVPEKPTGDMIAAGAFEIGINFPDAGPRLCQSIAADVWKAMVDKRPAPIELRFPGLTRRQSQIFEIIRDDMEARREPPTTRRVALLAGCKPSTAHELIVRLVTAGYLRRSKHGAKLIARKKAG